MIVRLYGTGWSVEQGHDLQALEVQAMPGADLTSALEGLGRPAGGDHVWLRVPALEEAAAARVAEEEREDWRVGFAAMVDYARTKGWVDDSGTEVRAHVVRA